MGACALNCYSECIVIYTAPTWRQILDNIWRPMRSMMDEAQFEFPGHLLKTPIWEIGPNRYMFGMTTIAPEKVAGLKSKKLFILVDEASGVNPAFFEGIQGLFSMGDTHMIIAGNPTKPAGELYDAALGVKRSVYDEIIVTNAWDTPNFAIEGYWDPRDPTHKSKLRDFCWAATTTKEMRIAALYSANPPYSFLVQPRWVADQELAYGLDSPMYRVGVMGEFVAGSDDDLIPLWQCNEAAARWEDMFMGATEDDESNLVNLLGRQDVRVPRSKLLHPEPFWTNTEGIKTAEGALDVARFGSNNSVYGLRNGPICAPQTVFNGRNCPQLVEDIQPLLLQHQLKRFSVDGDGLGGPYYDLLRAWAYETKLPTTMIDFRGGLPARNREEYYNARAEAYFGLQQRHIDSNIAYPKGPHIGQLSSLKYKYMTDGRKCIEAKDAMIKRGLVSPDNADQMMMMFAGTGFKFAGEGANNPNLGSRKGFSAGRSDMRKMGSRTSALGMGNDPEMYPDAGLKDGYGTGAGVGMGPGYSKQKQLSQMQPLDPNPPHPTPPSSGGTEGAAMSLSPITRTITQQVQILRSQLTDPLLSWAGRERIEAEIKAVEDSPATHKSNPLILTDGELPPDDRSSTTRFRGHGAGANPPKRKREYNPMESQEIDVDFVDDASTVDLPPKQGSKRRQRNYFGTSDPFGRGS